MGLLHPWGLRMETYVFICFFCFHEQELRGEGWKQAIL